MYAISPHRPKGFINAKTDRHRCHHHSADSLGFCSQRHLTKRRGLAYCLVPPRLPQRTNAVLLGRLFRKPHLNTRVAGSAWATLQSDQPRIFSGRLSISGYYAAFHSLGIPRKWIPLILLSPQILTGLNMGSIDALTLAAPELPPLAGFLLAPAKPQIGLGYLLFLTVKWICHLNRDKRRP